MQSPRFGVLALTGIVVACSDPTSTSGTAVLAVSLSGATEFATCTAARPADLNPPSGSALRASLAFINVAPRYAGVILCLSGWQETPTEPFSTGYGSQSLTPSSVPHPLLVRPTGDSTVLATGQVTLAVDTQYTVVFTQHRIGGGLLVLEDTVSAPPLGYRAFRVVNTVPTLGAIDVYALPTDSTDLTNIAPMMSNVAFEGVSPYVVYPAAPRRVIMTVAGHPGTVVYDSGNLDSVEGQGQVWTALLMYNSEHGQSDSLTTLWILDRN